MQSGCPSKDTWITASEPERVSELTAAPEAAAVAANTPLISLPSRVVENLYWLGRYAERAEGCLRVLRTVFVMLNGEDRISEDAKRILLRAVTKITATQPGFANASDEMFANPDEELLLIIRDGKRAGSIKSTLNSMLYCADESKELLSSDTMRVINDLRDGLDSLDSSLAGGLASAPEEALDPLVTALVALSGLTQESMVRGVGWHFMEMGKRVERAMHVINNVGMLMAPVAEHNDNRTMLTAMLTSMEVLITYRRRHRERMGIELGLDLVMLDSTNPRSLIFQFEQLKSHFDALQLSRIDSSKLTEEERALLEAITSLKLSRMGELLETETSQRENLKNFLTQLENLLSDFSNIVSDKYFDHRIDPQQLVTTYWGDQS
jgi:uncharacterized alpha-E superfamily protein